MHISKKVLLIAGGGTLGTYTAKELLRLGCSVDVLALQAEVLNHENYHFYKGDASPEGISEFLKDRIYDGIVNFIHYKDPEEYKKVYRMTIEKTDHLFFLSSYRVYADADGFVCESSARLMDVCHDEEFIKIDDYALPKSMCEDFLQTECKNQPWTIVRPVISFSDKRFDLYTYSGDEILNSIKEKTIIKLPEFAKKLTAGIDWAGNTGKLIASLMFKKEAFGEAFTVSSAQNLTWEEIAGYYERLCGVKTVWTDEAEFVKANPYLESHKKTLYIYDRKYDRRMDNSKILSVTGLSAGDFLPIYNGLEIELKKAGYIE